MSPDDPSMLTHPDDAIRALRRQGYRVTSPQHLARIKRRRRGERRRVRLAISLNVLAVVVAGAATGVAAVQFDALAHRHSLHRQDYASLAQEVAGGILLSTMIIGVYYAAIVALPPSRKRAYLTIVATILFTALGLVYFHQTPFDVLPPLILGLGFAGTDFFLS